MFKLVAFSGSLALLLACGQSTEDACLEYVEAYNACSAEYLESVGLSDTGGLTDSIDCANNANTARSTEYFNCLTDYYSTESCNGTFPAGDSCEL